MRQLVVALLICFFSSTSAMTDQIASTISFSSLDGVNPRALVPINAYIDRAYNNATESQKRELCTLAAMGDLSSKYPLSYYFWKFVKQVSDPISQLSMVACAVLPMLSSVNEKDSNVLSVSTTICAIASIVFGKIHGYAEIRIEECENLMLFLKAIRMDQLNQENTEEIEHANKDYV
ncbi:MAG: hypothetical protein LBQ08_00035 [Holosporaceae bacterium]|jgi:hypothetical protein|nr:hypothetical protein [Holosporaceae bacterium]